MAKHEENTLYTYLAIIKHVDYITVLQMEAVVILLTLLLCASIQDSPEVEPACFSDGYNHCVPVPEPPVVWV
jgi:hypothetical protein